MGFKKLPQDWAYPLAWLGIFLFALTCRFWQLDRLNTLVFDEVYFVHNGYQYLQQQPFFDIHPPLGKLLIALGIRLGQWLPGDSAIITQGDGYSLGTWDTRWLNAAFGSLLPLLVGFLIQTLTGQKLYALLAGFLVSLDGLLLVESRYCLLNIYLVCFGVLGHGCFFQALRHRGQGRGVWLTLAGLSLGAAASVKWNGAGYLLALYGLWGLAWLRRGWQRLCQLQARLWRYENHLFRRYLHPQADRPTPVMTPLPPLPMAETQGTRNYAWLGSALVQVRPGQFLLYLGVLPLVFYRLQWLPHLRINPDFDFWEVHRQIWNYNTRLGSGADVHPYCSPWNTWPWLLRPVAYFFQEVKTASDTIFVGMSLESLPRTYDVHAMGNPLLWWLSLLALGGLLLWLARPVRTIVPRILGFKPWPQYSTWSKPYGSNPAHLHGEGMTYLLVSYGANWLPWSQVHRCLYLYHHMPAAIFGFCALAAWIHWGFHQPQPWLRGVSVGTIALVILGFIYWLPIFLGLPLAPEGFHQRMWLRSWY